MLVSIIIPYYNDEENIYLSVSSALKQTYKNTEIIIIDNENSFLSKKILEKIKKKSKKIKIFRNKKLGNYAGIGRNIGVSHSKGKLIAFLDSDDFWSKNKLKLQVKELKDKIQTLFELFYLYARLLRLFLAFRNQDTLQVKTVLVPLAQ